MVGELCGRNDPVIEKRSHKYLCDTETVNGELPTKDITPTTPYSGVSLTTANCYENGFQYQDGRFI